MNVKLIVEVAGKNLPADFTVRDFNGNIVLYKRFIKPINFFCFNSQKRNLIFTVRPLDIGISEISKFYKLPCTKCVCIKLYYGYAEQNALQTFTLLDANYFFPVSTAILSFTS